LVTLIIVGSEIPTIFASFFASFFASDVEPKIPNVTLSSDRDLDAGGKKPGWRDALWKNLVKKIKKMFS
jgi:hypothetical protein